MVTTNELPASKDKPIALVNNVYPLTIIAVLFFCFGLVTNLNDILIPHLKKACELTSDFQSSLVQFAFYGAYFLMSLPSGILLQKLGYKNGIVLGLLIAALGSLLFIPAANTRLYSLFLVALSILAAGITILQVAANPYVTMLGPSSTAASRLSIMGTLNSLGATLGPFVGGILIFKGVNYTIDQLSAMNPEARNQYLNSEASLVQLPFLLLAILFLLLSFMVYKSKLPEIIEHDKNDVIDEEPNTKFNPLKYRHLSLGIIAIFMYVGAEVSVGSFIIRYGQFLNIEGFTLKMGARFVSYYMLLAMISRFIGIFIIGKYIKQENILRYYSTIAFILILISVSSNGIFALWCIVAIGTCNAIMWPTIFPLAIAGLGKHTKKASSFLIMAILGGAILPMLVGYFSDKIGIQHAYLINAIAYAYVAFYGFVGYKKSKNNVTPSLV